MARLIRSIAFTVLRNGRRVCIAGLNGKRGVITAVLDWVDRGQGRDEMSLFVAGLDSITRQHLIWSRQPLRVGGEVVIRIEENVKPSRVRARSQPIGKSDEQREKAWLRRTARSTATSSSNCDPSASP